MTTLDAKSIEYFRERERIERAAAKSATTEAARRAHLELAQGYAALIDQDRAGAMSPHRR